MDQNDDEELEEPSLSNQDRDHILLELRNRNGGVNSAIYYSEQYCFCSIKNSPPQFSIQKIIFNFFVKLPILSKATQ